MKRKAKILSIFLALVLTLTAFMIPATAVADNAAGVSFRMELTPAVGEMDDMGQLSDDYDVYKLTVYMTSTLPISVMFLDVNFDETIFQVVDGSIPDMIDWTYEGAVGYEAYYHLLGNLGDTNGYDEEGNITTDRRPPLMGGSHMMATADSFTLNYKYSNGTKGVLCISTAPGANIALPGGSGEEEGICEIYFKLRDGADANGAKFSFGDDVTQLEGQLYSSKQINYCTDAILGKFWPSTGTSVYLKDRDAVPTPDYTYYAAPAGPVVEKSKAELKFTLTSATTVADDYLFRVTSKVSDADWDAYFANTGTADATTNAIQALGFVAYKGTEGFSMDTAKAVAQGTPAEGYYNATTDYVQKESDTSDALFGAIIDTSKDTDADATYVAYIQYLDAEGQTAYAFYETAQTALLEQNYENYVQQYVNTYGGSFAA